MTPRTEVDAIPVGMGLPRLLAEVAATRHTRLPVYRDGLDDLVGVLHVHDLFPVLERPPERFDLESLVRPVLVAPESLPADDLLERMQARRRQLAVVVDEYAAPPGSSPSRTWSRRWSAPSRRNPPSAPPAPTPPWLVTAVQPTGRCCWTA
jgi:CBS domain containing-hemolysin-like protein